MERHAGRSLQRIGEGDPLKWVDEQRYISKTQKSHPLINGVRFRQQKLPNTFC